MFEVSRATVNSPGARPNRLSVMHRLRKVCSAFVALSAGVVVGSCGGGDAGFQPKLESQIFAIVVTPAVASLEPGETQIFVATVIAIGGDTVDIPVTWSISQSAVATMNDGLVTGVEVGFASIKASTSTRTGTASVTVVSSFEPPIVVTSSLPDAVLGEPYSARIEAIEGNGLFNWSVISGNLPPGLALAGPGAITGTPLAVGTSNFTVQVRSGGEFGTRALSLSVRDPLRITTTSLPFGFRDAPYAQSVTAGGGTGSLSFAVAAGALPTGLTLDTAGSLTGTPTVAGTDSFTVQVTSSDGQSASRDLSIRVAIFGSPPVISSLALPNAGVGVPYGGVLTATDGDGVYTWALTAGALPGGLTLLPDGTFSGVAAGLGTSNFTVEVTSAAQTVSGDFSIEVFPALTVATTSLPTGIQGSPYAAVLAASGGDGIHTWSVSGGALPFGLSLGSDGSFSGAPGASGTFDFTVQAASADQVATALLSIEVLPPVQIQRSGLLGGYINAVYADAIVSATGGDGSFLYSVIGGSLPAGVSLNPNSGALTGTAIAAGMAFFEIQATSAGSTASAIYSITISTQPASAFNLWGMNVADEIPSGTVQEALNVALARWEATVVGDVVSHMITAEFASACNNGDDLSGLLTDIVVDDVLLLVDIRAIDGPGSILAQAGICLWEDVGAPQSIVGRMTLDATDLRFANVAQAAEVIWHETGHVMGIGGFGPPSTWRMLSDLSNPNDPRFLGAAANAEYAALGGAASSVPLEGGIGPGSDFSHWDEGAFDVEIMTPRIDVGINPISRLTIAALSDLGWAVSFAAADAYSLPGCSPSCGFLRMGPVTGAGQWEKAPDWGATAISGRR